MARHTCPYERTSTSRSEVMTPAFSQSLSSRRPNTRSRAGDPRTTTSDGTVSPGPPTSSTFTDQR